MSGSPYYEQPMTTLLSKSKEEPAHINRTEISFHLSILRPSETLWFWRDAGTTVFERFTLAIQICNII